MRTAFSDPQLENQLVEDGGVIVNFLDPDELASVQLGIRKLGFGVGRGQGVPVPRSKLRISVTQGDVKKRDEIFDELSPVFQRAADRFLRHHALLRVGIFDKLPGGAEIRIHQHTNLVDESTYRSLATWLPLCDTSIAVGTLYVIKGSHEFSHHIRSYNDYNRSFAGISSRLIERYSTPLLLKAGQAIIFDDRLVHWSPRNRSSAIRTALQLELIPDEAELTVHFRRNDRELVKCRLDRTMYRQNPLNHDRPEKLEEVGIVDQPLVMFSDEQFLSMVRDMEPVETETSAQFLPRIFSDIRRRFGR